MCDDGERRDRAGAFGVIHVKPGVEFAVIAPAGFLILEAIKIASQELGFDLTITSGTDGTHSGPGDPHKLGEAYDIRSHDLADGHKLAVVKALYRHLGPRAFFAFLEADGTPNEHIHVQRRKDTTLSVADYLDLPPLAQPASLRA